MTAIYGEQETVPAEAEATVPETQAENYSITINQTGEGGTITSGAGTYDEGANVSVVATANAGYRFVEWNDHSTNATYTISGINANYDLTHYPAIEWSYLQNTWGQVYYPHRNIKANQWYVPSRNELRYLLLNHEAVSATLESHSCPTLEDKSYWSSTELGTLSAAYGKIQRDSLFIEEAMKTKTYYVRAVRNF